MAVECEGFAIVLPGSATDARSVWPAPDFSASCKRLTPLLNDYENSE